MGENTFGYRQPETAGTYWRRRFITLAIGFVIFGLAAWALSTALAVSTGVARAPGTGHRTGAASRGGRYNSGKPKPGSSSRRRAASHTSGKGTSGPRTAASDAATSGPAVTTKAASPASPVRTAGPAGPVRTASPARTNTVGQATGHGMIMPAFCAKRDIVLSLFTGQTQFGQKQWPAFDVSVVSTQLAECTFNIGSRHLALVIKEGPALIWSSADCAAGTGALDAALKRGVPTVLAISWNRRTSAPGCSGRTTKVPPGVYTGYAVEDGLTSQSVIFRLA